MTISSNCEIFRDDSRLLLTVEPSNPRFLLQSELTQDIGLPSKPSCIDELLAQYVRDPILVVLVKSKDADEAGKGYLKVKVELSESGGYLNICDCAVLPSGTMSEQGQSSGLPSRTSSTVGKVTQSSWVVQEHYPC